MRHSDKTTQDRGFELGRGSTHGYLQAILG